MGIFDVILTGVGLSMDASAVGMTNGLNEPKMRMGKVVLIALFFGVFQGLMPLIGYFAGSLFATAVAKIAPWVALILLGFIGGKMLYDGIRCLIETKKAKAAVEGDASKESSESACAVKKLTVGSLAVQAVATSIDALAVGITLLGLDKSGTLALNIFACCGIIAACTFALSLAAVLIGKRFGAVLAEKAQIVGGVILVAIGLKIFIEGVFF